MGLNWIGQLGLPLSTTYVPERVPYLEDVVAIDSGWYHSTAITAGGPVSAWGRNNQGQLGSGDSERSNVPLRTLFREVCKDEG
jgi:alpha-tubulin suppressor-like RCC1 family protein